MRYGTFKSSFRGFQLAIHDHILHHTISDNLNNPAFYPKDSYSKKKAILFFIICKGLERRKQRESGRSFGFLQDSL